MAANQAAVVRTAAAFFCTFLVGGVIGPFLSPTLLALGFSHTQVGLVMAGCSFVSASVPLLVGHVSDSYSSLGRLVRLSLALGVCVTLALWGSLHTPILFVALLLLLSVIRAPLSSLLDTLAMQAAHNRADTYGRIRLTGSAGFMVAATLAGWWIGSGHEQRFFPMAAGFMSLACATGFFLPEERRDAPRPSDHGFWQSLDRPFLVWTASMMLHWFAFAPYQYGFSMLLQEQNVMHELTGALWSVGVSAEILAFLACGAVFSRFSAYQVLSLSFAASTLRWALLGLAPSLPVIIASQLLHGPSFALFYSACMQIISGRSNGRFRSSYQGFFATLVIGVAACFGTACAGVLHGHMPFHRVILCMLPFEIVASLLLWSSRRSPLFVPMGELSQ